jgi:membrane protein
MRHLRDFLGGLAGEARALAPREATRAILRGFKENDLLTYASAISFRIVFAVIPFALFAIGLLGLLGLSDVWRSDIAPEVEKRVSGAVFEIADTNVQKVLAERQVFWVTLGAAIALWEVSSALRGVMGALNRVYDAHDARDEEPFARRIGKSIALAGVVTVTLLAALVAVKVLPRLLGDGAAVHVAGWAVGVALLFATIALIVRRAPAVDRPARWVSFGAVLVVVGWVAASLVYAWYVTSVADYGSVFGSLAAVMLSLGYVYLSTIVFLTGLQLDSLIRHEVEKDEGGVSPAPAPLPFATSRHRPRRAVS